MYIRLYCTPTGSLIDKKTYIFQIIERSASKAICPPAVPQCRVHSHDASHGLKVGWYLQHSAIIKLDLEQPHLMFAQVTGVCVHWKTKIQTLHFFLEHVCALTYLFDRQQLELCGRVFHTG